MRTAPAARAEVLRSATRANFALHCYPKTKTNMFVIMCSLHKVSGDRRLSDSDMPPAKAQRHQVLKKCHFDRREKSFLDPSHSLGMTGMGSSPLRPWRLCGRLFGFRLQLFANGRTSFSQLSLGKSVYCYPKIFSACANFLLAIVIVSIQNRTHRGSTEDADNESKRERLSSNA